MMAGVFTSLAVLVAVVWRMDIVMTIRIKASRVCIHSGIPVDHVDSCGSYDDMIFDLRRWTFKQFYPDLAARGAK